MRSRDSRGPPFQARLIWHSRRCPNRFRSGTQTSIHEHRAGRSKCVTCGSKAIWTDPREEGSLASRACRLCMARIRKIRRKSRLTFGRLAVWKSHGRENMCRLVRHIPEFKREHTKTPPPLGTCDSGGEA